MTFIDTQIISFSYKKNTDMFNGNIRGNMISSIVAMEFLGTFIAGKNEAKVYPVVLKNRHINLLGERTVISEGILRFAKQLTDRYVLDFNGEFDNIVIFSNESLSYYINNKDIERLMLFARHTLDKREYKRFRKRVLFLMNNDIKVIPLTERTILTMKKLYGDIKNDYNVKSNYRNSFMDLLILAASIERNESLITMDKELYRALTKCCDYLQVLNNTDRTISIACSDKLHRNKKISDNKGYINNGWRCFIKNRLKVYK